MYKGINKQQKRLLDREGEDCMDIDELPSEILQEFEALGDHELMYQASNRYLSDKAMARAHNRVRW